MAGLADDHGDDLRDTAYVWWLLLADVPPDVWGPWLAVLNEDERARAGRFVKAADRQQFIAAHAMLRAMLSHFLGGPPQDWQFLAGAHGKPALHRAHGRPDICFNISHTNGAVACAMTGGSLIGVDIEDAERTSNHLEIAEVFFAPSEVRLLRAAPAAERAALFLRLWTLKEAYIKASGLGVSMALDRFAFSLSPIAISFRDATADDPLCWQFDTIACAGRCQLSIAINTPRLITLRSRQICRGKIGALLGC